MQPNRATKTTSFSLEKHGFLFPNRFNLKHALRSPRTPFYYGLCGGMCFTALDLYYQQHQAPSFDNPDSLPKNLLSYLIKRQIHSTNLRSLFKLLQGLFLPTSQLLHRSITVELPKILRCLGTGHPVPIVLVRSVNFQNPTQNHQILILGYQQDNHLMQLSCYDPNYPGQQTWLRIDQTPGQSRITQSSGESVRGFFLNDYQRKSPPVLFPKSG